MLRGSGQLFPPSEDPGDQLGHEEEDTLRRLGAELAAVAALPVHTEKADYGGSSTTCSPRPMV